MGDIRHHRDHRIEQDLEIRLRLFHRVGGDGRGQMSSCRRSHDTNVIRVDVPAVGISAHQLDGLLGIFDGHTFVTMRHAVFQYDGGNTFLIEEGCPVIALVFHG